MDYGALLARGWRIVWESKYLIVLGFLAALGTGLPGRNPVEYSMDSTDFGPGFELRAEQFVEQYWAVFLGLLCVAFVVAVVLWLIRLASQGGLIYAAARLDAGEKLTFGQAFSAGLRKLGPMVGLNVLMFGAFTVLGLIALGVVVVGVGAVLWNAFASGSLDEEALLGGAGVYVLCLCAMACVLVPLYLLAMVVYPFAQRGLVLGDMGVFASIGHGWRVVRNNIAEVLILVVLFFAIGIVFAIAAGLIMVPLGFLAFLPAMLNLLDSGTLVLGNVIAAIVGGVVLAFLAGVVNSVLVAFRSTTVTLAYQEFVSKGV